jgi:ADP-ribose pyrophosphatase YjhB (NUDIX family)
MNISANGIVLNEFGELLLIQRDDTHTFAPPGGGCEINELPNKTAEREVEEETGIKARAVRLVGLDFLPSRPLPFLFLHFRCIQRGGTLNASSESAQVGFFNANPPPGPMLPMHRKQIENGFSHAGGAPQWGRLPYGLGSRFGFFLLNRLIYPWLALSRKRRGEPAYSPPPNWVVSTKFILQNEKGQMLWEHNGDHWALPASHASADRPPWELAPESLPAAGDNDLRLTDLKHIAVMKDRPEMCFVFSGNLSVSAARQLPATFAYFSPGDEPAETLPPDRAIAVAALHAAGPTTMAIGDSP